MILFLKFTPFSEHFWRAPSRFNFSNVAAKIAKRSFKLHHRCFSRVLKILKPEIYFCKLYVKKLIFTENNPQYLPVKDQNIFMLCYRSYKHAWIFCNVAHTRYIFPVVPSCSFKPFLKSKNLK